MHKHSARHTSRGGPATPLNMHVEDVRPAHESAGSTTSTNKFDQEHRVYPDRTVAAAVPALPVQNSFAPLEVTIPYTQTEGSPSSTSAGQAKPSCRQATQDTPAFIEIPVASWNIGGSSFANAVQSIARAEDTKPQIICLQEMPRREVGWNTQTEGDYSIVQYRHDDHQWRGNAVAFSSAFQVIRKRGCRFGIWLRLRHLRTLNECWIGSLRLSTGVNSDVTADELSIVCRLLPPTILPTILLGDYNTKLSWTNAAT